MDAGLITSASRWRAAEWVTELQEQGRRLAQTDADGVLGSPVTRAAPLGTYLGAANTRSCRRPQVCCSHRAGPTSGRDKSP